MNRPFDGNPKKKLRNTKYHLCPRGHRRAVLLVDVDTERIPEIDKNGNRQYYCLVCHHAFAVDSQGNFIP